MNRAFDGKQGAFAASAASAAGAGAHRANAAQPPQAAVSGAAPAAQGQLNAHAPNAHVPDAAAAAPASSRTGTALLVGVFLLSAAVGGGMAGLYLAMQGKGSAPAATASKGGNTAAIAVAPPQPMVPNKMAPKKDEERLTADANTAKATAPAVPPEAAREQAEAAKAGAAELKALTENVVAALGALNTAPEEKDIAEVEADAERLRTSLANLVNAALTQGKSEAEVRELLAAALEDAGEGNIPGILRDASGKLNLQKLLASIMPQDAARDMPMSAQERAYFEQLMEEADNDVAAAPARPASGKAKPARERKPKGRFFYENGKRYTIVRRGDTLSDIAYAAYGDVLAYPAILRANRGRISTRRLKPGTRIVVPELPRKTRRARTDKRSAAPISLIRRAAATQRKAPKRKAQPRKRASATKVVPAGQQVAAPEAAVPAGTTKITNFRSRRQAADPAKK